jgi:hypothetical protein
VLFELTLRTLGEVRGSAAVGANTNTNTNTN